MNVGDQVYLDEKVSFTLLYDVDGPLITVPHSDTAKSSNVSSRKIIFALTFLCFCTIMATEKIPLT